MAKDIYRDLAQTFDALPLGFPSAPSGVEMKILLKLFSPEEAEIASKMILAYESPRQIAERLGRKVEEVSKLLEEMLSKGLVDGRGPRDNREYGIQPYLGIHSDLPVQRIDEEYVRLFEQYLHESFAEKLGSKDPPNIRVLPTEQAIRDDYRVLNFEQVSELVARATHYVISDCACCKKLKLLGRDCGRRVHRCISLYYQDDFRADIRIEYREGRRATKSEVLDLLRIAEEEGFIHTGPNIQNGHSHICNCCPDCCPFLRMMRLGKSPSIIAPSNYMAIIEPDLCTACGICAEDRCPVNAIEQCDESYKVTPERCIGCGVCALTCPSGALSLRQKEKIDISIPPADLMQWFFHRMLGERFMITPSPQND